MHVCLIMCVCRFRRSAHQPLFGQETPQSERNQGKLAFNIFFYDNGLFVYRMWFSVLCARNQKKLQFFQDFAGKVCFFTWFHFVVLYVNRYLTQIQIIGTSVDIK